MASRTSSRSVSSGSVPTHRSTPVDLSFAEKAKVDLISTACEEGDVFALVELATSPHGLVSDDLRRVAWPILLGCANTEADAEVECRQWEDLPAHREEGQVDLDVNRAFVYYPKYGKHTRKWAICNLAY